MSTKVEGATPTSHDKPGKASAARMEVVTRPNSTKNEGRNRKLLIQGGKQYVPADVHKESKQVAQLLTVLQRTYQAFSFYPFNHPIVQQMSTQLYEELSSFFQIAPYLELRLDRFRILYYDEVVFEENNVKNNFVYLLYSDGIRKLIFNEGLSLEECFEFFAILHRCSGKRSLHDDVVTLMWEASLEHIRYFLIEDLSTTFLPSYVALSGEFNAVEEDSGGPSVRVSTSGASSSDGELALRMVKQLARSRVALNEQEQASLKGLVEEEEMELMHRFFEVLTLLLSNHKAAPQFEPLIRVLGQLQPLVVSIGGIEDMLLCFRYIKHIAEILSTRSSDLAKQWSTSLYEALPDAFSEQAIQRLIDELVRNPSDVETHSLVTQYIEFIELASPLPLLEAMLQLERPESRELWLAALVHKYKDSPRKLTPGITSEHEVVVIATCDVLGQIGLEEPWNLLERASLSDSLAIRVAALNAMLQLETSEANTIKLIDVVERYLADDKPEARIAAINGLVDLGPNAAFLLKTLFNYRTYEHWPTEEIDLLFDRVAQLGNYYGDIFEMLTELILHQYNGRFNNRKKLDIARTALAALQRKNTPQSAQVIERIYQGAAKPLRRICESIFTP